MRDRTLPFSAFAPVIHRATISGQINATGEPCRFRQAHARADKIPLSEEAGGTMSPIELLPSQARPCRAHR
jgi:hypothetical protein